MGTNAPGVSQLPLWGMITVGAYFAYRLLRSARAEERRRRQHDQPHTMRDTALLLLTALSIVGVLLCATFLKPLNPLVNSRSGIAAIIIVVGGSLTYVLTSRGAPHP